MTTLDELGADYCHAENDADRLKAWEAYKAALRRLEKRSECLTLLVEAWRKFKDAEAVGALVQGLNHFSGVMAAACVVEDTP